MMSLGIRSPTSNLRLYPHNSTKSRSQNKIVNHNTSCLSHRSAFDDSCFDSDEDIDNILECNGSSDSELEVDFFIL
eukprot:Awhi_evm1s4975